MSIIKAETNEFGYPIVEKLTEQQYYYTEWENDYMKVWLKTDKELASFYYRRNSDNIEFESVCIETTNETTFVDNLDNVPYPSKQQKNLAAQYSNWLDKGRSLQPFIC